VELERQAIERSDFPLSRRGYDRAEVQRHLSAVADAIERLERESGAPSSAAVAAEQVQAIVAAAERSAAEMREEAERAAAETRARAGGEAAAELERVRAAAEAMRQTVDEMARAARSLVDDLQRGSDRIRSELDAITGRLGTLGAPGPAEAESEAAPEPARPATASGNARGAAAPEAVAGPPDSEPEVVEETERLAARAGGERPGERAERHTPEGARLVALNMALSGTPREETARYLAENFDLEDQEDLLDEVYARAAR
jgi:hypothetical protein